MLKIGDTAPSFETPNQEGKRVKLSDFSGKKVLLYFYPKDDTPGCTKQACAFRDAFNIFSEKNCVILGVSRDTETKHRKFSEKYNLPFTLLSDTSGQLTEAYGVWVEKKLYGRTYMGIERTTFLIDEAGKIARIWPKVKVATHIDTVLADLDTALP